MTKKLSTSPSRYTFQKTSYLEGAARTGLTLENNEQVRSVNEWYISLSETAAAKEANPEWAKNNLEFDLRSTDWILEKARKNEVYAQNLYAALCNNKFQKIEMWYLLKDEHWSCSWRYAGGIIAHMLEKGDYIDWYCSGINNGDASIIYNPGYKPEGTVTKEITGDLRTLGWLVLEDNDEI